MAQRYQEVALEVYNAIDEFLLTGYKAPSPKHTKAVHRIRKSFGKRVETLNRQLDRIEERELNKADGKKAPSNP